MTIQNELVKRLIASIDLKYINMIDVEDMQKYKFFPISIKDNYLFVAINSYSDKYFIANFIRNILPYSIKYIQIPDSDLFEIINYIVNNEIEHIVNNNEENDVKKEKSKILIYLQVALLIFWIYKGFFPFNMDGYEFLHYWVYDGFHLAFNISNYEYNNNKYYCKISNNDKILKINETISNYENEIKNIDNKMIELQSSKYNVTDYNYEKVQSLYDYAHILKDNYYIKKGDKEKQLINLKLNYNKEVDEQIKILIQQKKINNVMINHEKYKMVVQYCTKL